MVIRSVTITHLRSHASTHLECAPEVTILSGPNGSGKTSLLEAVSLCSMGRTFVPVPDLSLIQHGHDACMASVVSMSDNDVPYRASVELHHGQRKRISTTHGSNLTARDLIGELPVVALSPDHKGITFGGPAERRAFIDAVMAQSSRSITDLLYEHRRTLKQRNAALGNREWGMGNAPQQASSDSPFPISHSPWEIWTSQFISLSVDLVKRRAAFLAELEPLVQEEYAKVAGVAEEIAIRYEPDHIDLQGADLALQFERTADRLSEAERIRGVTLFGPQKDEIAFLLNGRLVRETASQGQHKSLLIALKLAECRMLVERRRERPVVLLDDVFAELDQQRSERVLTRIRELGMQCLVTTTEDDRFRAMDMGAEIGLVRLAEGRIVETTIHTQERPS